MSTVNEFKKGDNVRVLVDKSLGGDRRFPTGATLTISGATYWNRKPCYVANGNYYWPDQLELVEQNPCSEIPEPHYLDRVIAEQKAYYAKAFNELPLTVGKTAFTQLTKETSMSLKIETKTFVNGAEIAKLSVEELVSLIERTENEIRKLEALDSKPKKVQAKIDELKAGLVKLVEHADAE